MSDKKIPILLCGKHPGHIDAVIEAVKPEFEVIKPTSTLPDTLSTITTTLSPTSPIKPVLILMGGGFSPSEYQEARNVPGAQSVPWLRPVMTKPGYNGPRPTGMPGAEELGDRVRAWFDGEGAFLKENGGKTEGLYGKIYYF